MHTTPEDGVANSIAGCAGSPSFVVRLAAVYHLRDDPAAVQLPGSGGRCGGPRDGIVPMVMWFGAYRKRAKQELDSTGGSGDLAGSGRRGDVWRVVAVSELRELWRSPDLTDPTSVTPSSWHGGVGVGPSASRLTSGAQVVLAIWWISTRA